VSYPLLCDGDNDLMFPDRRRIFRLHRPNAQVVKWQAVCMDCHAPVCSMSKLIDTMREEQATVHRCRAVGGAQ